MADGNGEVKGINVCVRVRPLNQRELDDGNRVCTHYDAETKQIALTAVDRNTLLQLKGAAARGFAFDKHYGMDDTSDNIYEDLIKNLVDNIFKGYNGTVLAYGQTGSGKTHTMSGGTGHYGVKERGITPRVIDQVFEQVAQIRRRLKPGESISISATAVEIYNEEFRDLSKMRGKDVALNCWDTGRSPAHKQELKLMEIPTGQAQERRSHRLKPGESVSISATTEEIYHEEFRDLSKTFGKDVAMNCWDTGSSPVNKQQLKLMEILTGQGKRVRAEVSGLYEQECETYEELLGFFQMCFENRSTGSTKLNDSSSRSHALFTINVHRVVVSVGDGVDENLKARVRTEGIESKLHLVDLAGSERVKRSGVEGKQFKEATKINSGLLALGNVIVALAENASHIPYRDSKLTRLIQDSLGGNSLTVLITCISPSEADFEETNNTLKYANRACSIENQPLPNKFLMMEEDLLPTAPGAVNEAGISAGMDIKGVVSIEALLEENLKQRELKEKRRREKEEKDRLRREALSVKKEQLMKTKGYQRLLAQEFDRKLKEARRLGKRRFLINETVDGQAIAMPDYAGGGTYPQASGSSVYAPSLKGEASSSSGAFNLQNFIRAQAEGGTPSGLSSQPSEVMDTSTSAPPPEAPPKHLSPALARALARKQKQQAETAGAAAPVAAAPGQPPEQQVQQQQQMAAAQQQMAAAALSPADAAARRGAGPHTPDLLDHSVDEEEDLGAEVEAQVREAAEKAALKKAAEEVGERLDDEPSGLDDDEGDTGDAYYDDEDDGGIIVLARFKVNKHDVVSVFKATTKEDFKDVVKLLPENTPLPASNKMTYLIARLELNPAADIEGRIALVNAGRASMGEAVGPAVGCLMATFGTNMISSCIFDFDDPDELEEFAVEERIELWGLQIPHNSIRPVLRDVDPEALAAESDAEEQTVAWSSVDRLNMSVGLLYALCVNANASSVRCGFCVPRSQLLRRWQGAGVRMKEVMTKMRLIYPPHAHDFEYYKSSTVAYFLAEEVADGLKTKLALLEE